MTEQKLALLACGVLLGVGACHAQNLLPTGATELTEVVRASVIRDVENAHKASFDGFLKSQSISLAAARASIQPDLTAEKFEALRRSHEHFYRSLKVRTTVWLAIPQSTSVVAYDCIAKRAQAAAATVKVEEAPPADPYSIRASAPKPAVKRGAQARDCPLGWIALKRNTLAEVIASPSAKPMVNPGIDRDALRVLLGRGKSLAPRAPYLHRYAHALAQVPNFGVHSRLNVWSPRVIDGDMSLSQVWIVAGDPDNNSLQTLEAGWQVMSLWASPFSALFIYSTSDNYNATGCYVTKCGVESPPRPETFFITTNKAIVGSPIASQSQSGGNQAETDVRWIRSGTGNWWLKVDGEWVGYYPAQNFADGAMANGAAFIDFGGEATGFLPTSEMGSGFFASTGKGQAAYQSHIEYIDASGAAASPSLQGMTTDPCYTISLTGTPTPDDAPGTYFYFGGPGNRHFGIPPPADESSSCIGG